MDSIILKNTYKVGEINTTRHVATPLKMKSRWVSNIKAINSREI